MGLNSLLLNKYRPTPNSPIFYTSNKLNVSYREKTKTHSWSNKKQIFHSRKPSIDLQAQYIFYNTTANINKVDSVIQICRAIAHHRSLVDYYIIIYTIFSWIKDKAPHRPSMHMHSSMVTYFMSGYSSVASTPTLFCWIRWQSPSHAASPRRRRGMHAQSLAESWEGTRTLRQRQTASD